MDKEQYKQRLHTLVVQLKSQEEKELLDYLLSELSTMPIGAEKIEQIYEYCIEKNARCQAEQFYLGFPIREIIPSLVNDFVRMEMFRRRDNFGDFCLALYQQIEGITNQLCINRTLDEIVGNMWEESAYISIYDDISKQAISPKISVREKVKKKKYSIADLIFPGKNRDTKTPYAVEKAKKPLQNQFANDKMRIIVYYFEYSAMLKNSDYESYNKFTSSLNDIYQCRNWNHRGSKLTEWEQAIFDRIELNRTYYYLHFLGTLARYVRSVITGYPKLGEILQYAKNNSNRV